MLEKWKLATICHFSTAPSISNNCTETFFNCLEKKQYKFDPTDREVFESTREEALGSADFSGQLCTRDLDKYVTAISTVVDKAIPKAKSVRSESNPISDETIALIKEKSRLRRHYSQNKDPAVKTRINQLQKQVNPIQYGGGGHYGPPTVFL